MWFLLKTGWLNISEANSLRFLTFFTFYNNLFASQTHLGFEGVVGGGVRSVSVFVDWFPRMLRRPPSIGEVGPFIQSHRHRLLEMQQKQMSVTVGNTKLENFHLVTILTI